MTMLNFSFSSVVMTLLFCNLSLLFLAVIFSNRTMMLRVGFPLLKVICVLVIARMCFPWELPVTTNIYWPERISDVIATLCHPWFEYTFFNSIPIEISIWTILVMVWFCGTTICFCRYCHTKYSLYRFIFCHGTEVTGEEPFHTMLSSLVSKKLLRKRIHIYTMDGISSPMISKFVHYYIMLPQDMGVSETELSFILSHEISHALHHDLNVKFLVQILCMVYWWNPACVLLKHQMELLLESRTDADILSGDTEEKIDYLRCLMRIAEECTKDSDVPYEQGITFFTRESSLLVERFELMTSDDVKTKKYAVLLLLPVCLLYLFSLFYILEADGTFPSEIKDGNYIVVSKDNTYLIRNHDGTYDVYVQGEFFEKEDSLEYYKDNYKIYDSLEEAEREW